ncbi:hypothetical protein [Streptomyces sp. NPDC093223]|uniref:hypothetical protein n=1 Tax=Streptomyces sp. NPDC093223 TaxID=3366033 RepID=UPI00382D6F6E
MAELRFVARFEAAGEVTPLREKVVAEQWQDGVRVARWTDLDGPDDLVDRLPALREQGWLVYDFRDLQRPVEEG